MSVDAGPYRHAVGIRGKRPDAERSDADGRVEIRVLGRRRVVRVAHRPVVEVGAQPVKWRSAYANLPNRHPAQCLTEQFNHQGLTHQELLPHCQVADTKADCGSFVSHVNILSAIYLLDTLLRPARWQKGGST